jgi:hypothetical protein
MIIFSISLLALASVEPVVDIPEPRPSLMSKTEIRDHNAKLDRTHRFYIRCVKAPDTGSLVARRSVCRTNDQWAAVEAAGRDQARNMADEAVARSASRSN